MRVCVCVRVFVRVCISVEDALDDEACDRNLEGFLRTVAVGEQMTQEYVSHNL